MLISLMFHRVHDLSQNYTHSQFKHYLHYLVDHFNIVTPGDSLSSTQKNLCLTFDDAYCDFYYYVYPLLKKYNLKALLAVPVQYIVEKTQRAPETRLSVPYPEGMSAPLYEDKVPFCTWDELKEMADSQLVILGSHSYSHANLTHAHCDLEQEIIFSKYLMEEKLKCPVESFVYPFGRYNDRVHQVVKQHYTWDFRIGSALNYQWERKGPIYRVDAENLWPFGHPLSSSLLLKLKAKYWANKIRGK